jgi:hypothetical protein
MDVGLEKPSRDPSGGGAPLRTTLSGDWVATIVGATATDYDVAYELQHARVTGDGVAGASEADRASFERRLGHRFWVTYQPDGAATRAHFPRDMADDVRNLLQLVVTEMQLTRPAQAAPQWTSTERDGAGTYFAAYSQPSAGEILKKKLRYVAVDGASAGGAPGLMVHIERSEVRFGLDGLGRVETVNVHDASRVDSKMAGMNVRVDVSVRLDNTRSSRAPDLVGSLERARTEVESQPIVTQQPTEEEAQARRDARLIEGTTIDELLAAVRDGRTDERTPNQLAADLRRRVADIAPAVAFARSGVGDDASRTVLWAIGTAGTPPAQRALCALARDAAAPAPLRIAAMTGLVLVKRPTAETIADAIALMDVGGEGDLGRQALLTAGSVAHNSATGQVEQAPRLERALLDRYARCGEQACLAVLAALGNLGTPSVIPIVEQALQRPAASERAAAIDALRLVEAASADSLIAATMANDQSAEVRLAAASTARFRRVAPLLEALAHAAESDPSESVRIEAINVLSLHLDDAPLAEQALALAAAKDPKSDIRRLARKALGPRAPDTDGGPPG